MTNQRATAGSKSAEEAEPYPGEQIGLPEYGPGSVAGWSRRLVALFIDWVACSLIAIAFFYHPTVGHNTDVLVQARLWTLPVFGVEDFLLTALTGFTIGKRLLRLRVIRLDGRPVGPASGFVRTLLLMLVVPTLVMDRDLRGLQDKAARTVVIRI